jgi:hypothetical protein
VPNPWKKMKNEKTERKKAGNKVRNGRRENGRNK